MRVEVEVDVEVEEVEVDVDVEIKEDVKVDSQSLFINSGINQQLIYTDTKLPPQ